MEVLNLKKSSHFKMQNYKNKKILITGSSGFIGFHTAKKFLDKGIEVIGIDSVDNYYDIKIKKERCKILKKSDLFTFHKCDINNIKKMNMIISDNKVDSIIFLSAQAGVRYSFENPSKYFETNIKGFFNLCEISRINNVRNIYFASSSSVYGDSKNNKKLEINFDTSHPISLYAATKKTNEVIAHSYAKMFGINFTGLRFFTVYGEFGRPDMSIFKFTKNIFQGKKIDVYNKGNHARDFTNIEDVSEYIYRIYKKQNISTKTHEYKIFNLCRGKKENLMKIINLISMNVGKKALINYLPFQNGDVHTTHGSNKEVIEFTNYKPKVDIEHGIKNFVNWYKNFYKL